MAGIRQGAHGEIGWWIAGANEMPRPGQRKARTGHPGLVEIRSLPLPVCRKHSGLQRQRNAPPWPKEGQNGAPRVGGDPLSAPSGVPKAQKFRGAESTDWKWIADADEMPRPGQTRARTGHPWLVGMPYHTCVREKVLRYIRERGLLHAGDRVAVAVSGGADSVALLRLLTEARDELGLVLTVAHFNHRLRGEASEADAAFVEELAHRLELPFLCEAQDAQEYAAQQKLGIEAAARELRYRWLARVAAESKQTAVATAHTLDDQAETVLLKFLRGAGTRGLAGVYPEVQRRWRAFCASAALRSPQRGRSLSGFLRPGLGAKTSPISTIASRAIACATNCCRCWRRAITRGFAGCSAIRPKPRAPKNCTGLRS